MELSDFVESERGLYEHLSYIAQRETGELMGAETFDIEELAEFSSIIQTTINIARELKALPLNLLLSDKRTALFEAAKLVSLRFMKLKEFTEGKKLAEWQSQKDGFLSTLRNNCQSFFGLAISVYPYLALKSSGVQLQTGEADRLLRQFKVDVEFELKNIKEKSSEFDSILQVARDTAAQAAVSHHASVFGGIADEHARASKKWLIAAVVSVLVTFATALAFLFLLPPLGELREAATIQQIITKSDTPAKGGGLVNVTASKAVGLNYVDL